MAAQGTQSDPFHVHDLHWGRGLDTALWVRLRATARFILLWSAAITCASRGSGGRRVSAVPSFGLGAPQVDYEACNDEFKVGDDLAATSVLTARCLLHLPVGNGPQAQRQFRTEVRDVGSSALSSSAAPGSVRTYLAVLKNIARKVTSKLGSSILPMTSEASFDASFGSVVLIGPRPAASSTAQPAVRWSYMKLVKAAVAYWLSLRGVQPVFDAQWSPRMGVFGAGIQRACSHISQEKAPLLLGEMMSSLLERAAAAEAAFRDAAESG